MSERDPFDSLARRLLDAGAATTAQMIRTGRYRGPSGLSLSLPRQIGGGSGETAIGEEPDDEIEPVFDNPMENTGSLIVGGEAGAPEELAIGTEGSFLAVVAGVLAWVAAGEEGSVLMMQDGLPVWIPGQDAGIGGGTTWSILTTGDPVNPELIFADGDVIMVQGA